MVGLRTEFAATELLESHPYAAPLFAGGVRCHGGFDASGAYVSPRTKHRVPAVDAWERQRVEQFATPRLDYPLEQWPGQYPNVAQSRYLLGEGVREPMVSTLTRIGTVEGFGAMIRYSVVPDLQARFVEPVAGTAMAHLDRGLYEAHARDEAGHETEGGHKQMWFAARDVAFEQPITDDETDLMLQRMGVARPGAAPPTAPPRLWPDDVDHELELLVERMARLLLIEIGAFHTFAWAEEVLSDRTLVAGEGEAARLVSYIRADETPHVEYLKTTLSEMRDRTIIATSGRRYSGAELIGRTWDRAVSDALGPRRQEGRRMVVAELEHTLDSHPRRADILAHFHELESHA